MATPCSAKAEVMHERGDLLRDENRGAFAGLGFLFGGHEIT